MPGKKKAGKSLFAPLLLAVIVLIIGSLPYFEAFLAEDAQHVFSGYLHYPEDMDSYAMWTRQSGEGAWLFKNQYDTGKPPPVYLNTLWLSLGKLRAATGVSFATAFQLLRVAAAFLLIAAFWWMLGVIGVGRVARTGASILFALGGGFGFIARFQPLKAPPPDLYTELFPFVQTSLVPHTALAHAFLILALTAMLLCFKRKSFRWGLVSGILLLALGSFRAYDLAVAWTLAALFLLSWLLFKRKPETRTSHAAAVLFPPLLAFAYAAWLSRSAPGFSVWSLTNEYPPADLSTHLIGMGIAFPGACLWLAATLKRFRRLTAAELFVAVWILAAWGLMFSGLLPWAWRTSAAFMTPHVAALALFADRFRWRWSRAVLFWLVLIAIAAPSSALVLKQKIEEASNQYRYYFQPPEVLDAIDWIGRNRPDAVVMTHGHVSLKVAARTPAWVLLGHKDLTEDFIGKRIAYGEFGRSKFDMEALKILGKYDVDTILWGPLDRRFSERDPGKLPGWKKVFGNGLVNIYGRE